MDKDCGWIHGIRSSVFFMHIIVRRGEERSKEAEAQAESKKQNGV